jgi:hypothetical protein
MVTDGRSLNSNEIPLHKFRSTKFPVQEILLYDAQWHEVEVERDKRFRRDFITWYWRSGIWTNISECATFNIFNISNYFKCATTNSKFKIRRIMKK